MDQQGLSSRAIMGMYYRRLEMALGVSWVGAVSNLFNSDQESETYKFLGQTPALREWIGSRQATGFRENGITLTNKHYEATVEVELSDIRRDKTGQIRARIEDMADRAAGHWASLLSTLIANGPSTVCYDGQFFFDTDHTEGDSGTQDNDITVDISEVPAQVAGTITAPGAGEIQWSIQAGINQMLAFVDDRGEPMNENASAFMVIVPPALFIPASLAMASVATAALAQNVDANLVSGMSVDVAMDPRSSWTDSFAVFRTDSAIKPLIRQQETDDMLKAKAEGSEFEFDNDAWQFGVDAWREVGYGYWQHAVYVTMT